MIVGSYYPGDDVDLAWKQHRVYWRGLSILVGTCNRFTRIAVAILQDQDHPEWGRIDSFDHRTLQGAHDLLAAAWRFEASPPQSALPLVQRRDPEPSEARWLEWLESEVLAWTDEPYMIRLVQIVLTNQNQPKGYEAESTLERLIVDRFHQVPWHKELRPD